VKPNCLPWQTVETVRGQNENTEGPEGDHSNLATTGVVSSEGLRAPSSQPRLDFLIFLGPLLRCVVRVENC
jgi:hypothetical protein